MRSFRRVLVVSLTLGMLVIASCGQQNVERGGSGRPSEALRARPTYAQSKGAGRPRSTTTTTLDLLSTARAVAHVVKVMFPPTTTTVPVTVPRPPRPVVVSAGSVNGYPCGNDLPPCYVLYRESHGIPTIVEGGGSPYTHASGLWQFMPRTWNAYAGYPYAAAAPPDVQNAKAREVWAGGAGCSHWLAC